MEIRTTLGPEDQITARWDKFELKSDKPAIRGGKGEYPSPFEYFLVGLANCTSFYVLDFCRTRDIPVENIEMVQRLVMSDDGQQEKAIEMELILPPEFPEKYEKAVVRAASMCHVKKTIMNPPEITLATRRG